MSQKPSKQAVTAVKFDILHTAKGHLEMTLETDTPSSRKEMAAKIVGLIREHKAVIFVKLANGEDVRITGYDHETNEWILKPLNKHEKELRAGAGGSNVTTVAPISGG